MNMSAVSAQRQQTGGAQLHIVHRSRIGLSIWGALKTVLGWTHHVECSSASCLDSTHTFPSFRPSFLSPWSETCLLHSATPPSLLNLYPTPPPAGGY